MLVTLICCSSLLRSVMSVHVSGASVAFWRTSAVSWSPTSCNIWRQLTTFCSWKRFVFLSRGKYFSETCSNPSADTLPVKLIEPMYISTRDSSTLYRSYGPFTRVSVNSEFFFAVCVTQGQIVAQGTYRELQCSDLDIVSLLRSDEEQDRWSQTADPDRQSAHSQSTIPSQSSHCSDSRLLPQESSGNKELPVGALSPQTPACSFRISLSISSLHGIPSWIFSSRAEVWQLQAGRTKILTSIVPQAEMVPTMMEETRAEGNVSRHVYFKYFTAGCNLAVLMAIVLLSVIAEVSHGSYVLLFHLFSKPEI